MNPASKKDGDAKGFSQAPESRVKRLENFETKTFVLKYAQVSEVTEALNKLCKQLGLNEPAVAFPESHMVVVAAPTNVVKACAQVITEVDRKPRQVYVEARFLDLQMETLDQLGITWSVFDDLTVNGNVSAEYANQRSGDEANMKRGLYKGTLSASELSIVLKALKRNADSRLFAKPRVIVSSGKKASVDMTTKRPNVIISAKRTTGNGNNNFDVDSKISVIPGKDKLLFAEEAFFWWGIELDVECYVADDGVIIAHIIPDVSTLSDASKQSEGAYVEVSARADGEYLPSSKYPILEVKRIETEFALKSGETAVIGGLTRTESLVVDTSIPYLSKIPYIGPYLFGSSETTKIEREIVVLVTMGLVDPENPTHEKNLLSQPKFVSLLDEKGTGDKDAAKKTPAKEPGDFTLKELIRMYHADEMKKKKESE